MSKYKLLVIDIDGTLLDGRGAVSPEDRDAIARARDRGVLVSLSTGRALRACTGVLAQLVLDSYHVFFDGALVTRPDLTQEVYVKGIAPAVVRGMVELAHAGGFNLELYSRTGYFAERESWSTRAHEDFFDMEFYPVSFDGIWEREVIVKGGLTVTTRQEAERAEDFFRRFAADLHVSQARTPAYPGIVFNNILAPEVSKGAAVTALASYLGVSTSEVMAVGDGSNDIPLFAAVGLSVAMGNAADEVKAVADHVTLDVEHSGLAEAIGRFLL